MGELGAANPKGNGPPEEARAGFGSGWKSCPPPDLASIGAECLSAAEEAAEQVLNCVHPTLDSEEKRRDVVDYVQQLVQNRLNCEVVSYGSVPLKTYLPDGDIDLTVLKDPNAVESLAHDVLALLQDEERNENAEYQVKETQFIDAEVVKLVKCFVRNYVIDISFNQLGGLSTLCFLEQVDRLVGRDHLFKRSIILIKTWCYYESRILGAHHGLISTYALEILVLYIFHHFHSSLTGPLSALYKFLDYYSQFDWENYCICLKGPVCKSSLPDIVVKMPEGGCNHLLLSEEFLKNCLELFSVPSRGIEENSRAFKPKHLNIIDPLKENNNLGRSVHRGNFYRIRSAFKFGVNKLGQVLLRSRDEVADEIYKFFKNTRSRHERQYKSSLRHLAFDFGDEESFTESLSSQVELFSEDDDMLLKSSASDFDNISVSTEHIPNMDLRNGVIDRHSAGEVSPKMASEVCYSADDIFVSGYCLLGAKHVLATSNSSSNYSASLSDNHIPNPHSTKSSTENGSSEAQQSDLPSTDSDKFGSISWSDYRNQLMEMKTTYRWCVDNSEAVCLKGSVLEDMYLDFREMDSASIGGDSEAFNPLADLSGDYEGNIRSLLRGQFCHGFSVSSSAKSHHPPSPTIQNRKPWDVVRQSMPLQVDCNSNNNNNNNFSQMSYQMVSTGHTLYSGPHSRLSGNAFHFDGKQKARGTGTYFPHMNVVCMERSSYGRGKNKAPGNENHFHRYGHANGNIYPAGETKSFENGGYEVFPARKKYYGRKRKSDVRSQSSYSVKGGNQDNGCLSALCRIKFGSLGNLGEEVISRSAHIGGSTVDASLRPQGSPAVLIRQRVAGQSIRLKNEDEFPPLCQ
ncbi:PAP/OAS1 substrate-binding domain superfamily [Striga hermonthica]|uniref:PAP/OAS1 substrate-binding domain superfamily n=1 Tax=Striga hermonthica TaxID=68872 RepID=A0A9N7P0J5_STRHE|nr:PAP/OAS1 substrate-binding domain superfamily [Striga hermonthica]